MSKAVFALILIAGLVYIFKFRDAPSTKFLNLSLLESKQEVNTCLGREYCFVVYVAPWCPACHQFIQFYRQYSNQIDAKNLGFVFIVGADENRTNEVQMKESLNAVGVLDSPTHTFQKAHKIRSFPTVYVLQKTKEVIHQGKSSYTFLNKKLNEP